MRIDISEPSLVSLFEKGQVGLIRTELMRLNDVIGSLNSELERLMTNPTSRLLRAEREKNARLRASSFVTAVPVEQYERVIEAGDALVREICILGPVDDKEKKAIDAWNAAKEGKQP